MLDRRSASTASPQRRRALALTCAAVLATAGICHAQGEGEPTPRQLQQRNRELEARLAKVEGLLAAQAEEVALDEEPRGFGMGATYGSTSVTFQLFGDVGFGYRNPEHHGESNSAFAIGAVDFFVNAQLGDHFRIVSETVIDGATGDSFMLSQERLWAAWDWNDNLYIKLGLEHSRISRWNQLYHHGRFLETTIERPVLVRFEGHDGILPLHHSGLEIGGVAHLDAGAFEYFGAVSNGRGPVPTDKQRFLDRNSSERIDIGLAFRPSCISGLRVGSSFTFDEIPPDLVPNPITRPERVGSMRELIAAANVELELENWSFVGEVAWIGHEARTTGKDYDNHSGYLQAAYRWEDWTPYARFDYRNMAEGDPFYGAPFDRDTDLWFQAIGVRCDLRENMALKLEFSIGREEVRDGGGNITERTAAFAGLQLSWSL